MYKNKRIVSLVPLRGGSKRIPRKNIKSFNKKPLAYWALSAIFQSKYIDEVYVSTEDTEIKKLMRTLHPKLKIINRPRKLAKDTTPEQLVHLHFMEHVSFNTLIIVHATNPFTEAEDLDRAIEQFETDRNDSMITGTLYKRFYWTPGGKPLNYNPLRRSRMQDFEGVVHENGAFYITRPETLKKYRNFLGGKIGIYLYPEGKNVDIDEPSDWQEAEKKFVAHRKFKKKNQK